MNNLLNTSNRRQFLKGIAGASLLLPQFTSLAKSKQDKQPVRMIFLQVPNGKIMNKWTPQSYGKSYNLSQTLEPLKEFKQDFQLISGLRQHHGFSNGDGAGDHARAQGNFLTGKRILKSASRVKNGISVDQLAAKIKGTSTYLPSLELSSQRGRMSGSCDDGYSCLYQYNLSWASETQALIPESSPQQAFNRLFTLWDGKKLSKQQNELAKTDKSILDYVNDSAKGLKHRLGKEDLEKLEQYFDSLRAAEKRIHKQKPRVTKEMIKRDFSKNCATHQEKIETLMDVLVLALEADATRVSSFILAQESSNINFPELGIKSGHHSLSHHRNNKDSIKKLEKIDQFYIKRLLYFLTELKKRQLNGRSLLDQSMVFYGSGLSDGDKHRHDNLPILLAGHGGGSLQAGYHREYRDKPLCNLYLSMLQKFDCNVNKFGDSTGPLAKI